MNNFALILAVITAFSMAGGQLLFKLGAAKWSGESLSGWIISFLSNPCLMAAIFLYAATIVAWIYVLRVLPLSIAYPLTALAYIIVPVMSFLFLGEKISIGTFLGSVIIVLGVVVCQYQGGK